MKININVMTASEVVVEFDYVRMDKNCEERPIDTRVAYFDRSGTLCEGSEAISAPITICEKIGCSKYEVVIGRDGKYALMMWNETDD